MTNTVIVGSLPDGFTVNLNTNLIYVANDGTCTVSIHGATNKVVATVALQFYPFGVDINPSTNHIYVSEENANAVSVIDGNTNNANG